VIAGLNMASMICVGINGTGLAKTLMAMVDLEIPPTDVYDC